MASAAPGTPAQTIDFGRAFTFTADDPNWLQKILIGGAFALACGLVVGIPFVLGYAARTLVNTANGLVRPLPEWDDLGGLFSEGLRLTGVYLVHMLGVLLVLCAIFALLFLPMILAHSEDPGEALGALGVMTMVGLYGLLLLVSLATAIYVPAALVRSALKGSFAAGLEWRENLAFIKTNLANYALALVAYLVAGFVAQFGVLLCCVGVFPAMFWSYLVLSVALGQTARLAGLSS
jgi:hypothetical protein